MAKIIMHIDLNAFFATAEELRHPEWRGKPLIIGGVGVRSVVSTASYTARRYGVRSGMSSAEAHRLCPNGIFFQGDYSYYEMLSRSFFSYLRNFSSLIEQASIDEGFVDLTKALSGQTTPFPFLKNIQDGLLKEIGLKCSIGLAPTKFLAKMASDMKKPMGITVLRRKDIPLLLYPLPISSFYGIGKKTSPDLEAMGIKTIGDFASRAKVEDPLLVKRLGKFFTTAKDWVEGKGDDVVSPEPFDPKSIGHSQTFSVDTADEEEILTLIKKLSIATSRGAKSERKSGTTVQLTIKEPSFKTHCKSTSFRDPTNEAEDIYSKARSLYEKNFLGMEVRLAGVTLQNLQDFSKKDVQMSLWNYSDYEKRDETRLLVNSLNRKLGKKALQLGSDVKKNED